MSCISTDTNKEALKTDQKEEFIKTIDFNHVVLNELTFRQAAQSNNTVLVSS